MSILTVIGLFGKDVNLSLKKIKNKTLLELHERSIVDVNVKEAIKLIDEQALVNSPFYPYAVTLKDIKRILLIGFSTMPHINSAINSLRKSFKEAYLTVLIKSLVKENLENNQLVNEIILYNKTKFNLFRMGIRTLMKLRKKKFNLVVILYDNPIGKGYFQLELIPIFAGIKNKIVYDDSGNVFTLDFISWIEKILLRSKTLEMIRPIGILTYRVITILYFFLLMIVLWISDWGGNGGTLKKN